MSKKAIEHIRTALKASTQAATPHAPWMFGTVYNVNTSGAQVKLEPEDTNRVKRYQWAGGNMPSVGDRVLLAWVNGSYVILGAAPGFAGSDRPGTVIMGGWLAPPAGTVDCDGSAYSRTDPTYARLFAAIGASYGVGDGSTTFNVPNYMAGQGDINRFPIGGVTVGQDGGGFSHQHTLSGVTVPHNHQLNATGFAAITYAGSAPSAQMLRAGAVSWVANEVISGSAVTATGATGQNSGAALLGATSTETPAVSGSTDISSLYPPWQGLRFVIQL